MPVYLVTEIKKAIVITDDAKEAKSIFNADKDYSHNVIKSFVIQDIIDKSEVPKELINTDNHLGRIYTDCGENLEDIGLKVKDLFETDRRIKKKITITHSEEIEI